MGLMGLMSPTHISPIGPISPIRIVSHRAFRPIAGAPIRPLA